MTPGQRSALIEIVEQATTLVAGIVAPEIAVALPKAGAAFALAAQAIQLGRQAVDLGEDIPTETWASLDAAQVLLDAQQAAAQVRARQTAAGEG